MSVLCKAPYRRVAGQEPCSKSAREHGSEANPPCSVEASLRAQVELLIKLFPRSGDRAKRLSIVYAQIPAWPKMLSSDVRNFRKRTRRWMSTRMVRHDWPGIETAVSTCNVDASKKRVYR